jgi:hypothetical protein
MKITPRGVLRAVPALIVVIVVAVWAFSYHSFEFRGGSGIRDLGFFHTHATVPK